ncbi:hypothetical protein LZ11_02346 [Thermosediminibacter litoriperuensis]|uniref:Uncharacterized protein n=1 Tax=Thermosediminibacter litoriperuensis TaxID=291989 RepID=A0A5S5AEM4_9FIRM|nr:hypothetical protein LZ11_02346 [Thermosediminibacter litoriperuensis]
MVVRAFSEDCINFPVAEFLALFDAVRPLANTLAVKTLVISRNVLFWFTSGFYEKVDIANFKQAAVDVIVEGFTANHG